MRRFLLTNKIGFDLKSAVENPSLRSSVIQVIDNDGTIIDEIPWTPITNYMYDPQPDPRYQRPFKVKTSTGIIDIPPVIPENTVTSEENPFVQLIYRFCSGKDRKIEEIIRHLTHEKKVLPDNKFSINVIKNIVSEMYTGMDLGSLLIKKGHNYVIGTKIKMGRHLITLHSGYDPFEYEIISYAERKSAVSRDEIYDLIGVSGSKHQWARYDKTVDYYIKKLLKQKCIIVFGKDWYRYKKYPERML